MSTRWLHIAAGQATYYQDGEYIYSPNGVCKFSVSAGWWHDIQDGKAEFYIADGWVYSVGGEPAYYFG
jgi:hypothetical protein